MLILANGDPILKEIRRRSEPKARDAVVNLPARTVSSLHDVFTGFFKNYPQQFTDFVDKLGPTGRAIVESTIPGAGVLTDVAENQQTLARRAEAAKQRIAATGANPNPTYTVGGDIPIHTLAGAGGPITQALARFTLPEKIPVKAQFTKQQAGEFVGAGIRQVGEFEQGSALAGALPAVQRLEKAAQLSGKFNLARVLKEAAGGASMGFTETYVDRYADKDGTYDPAKTLGRAVVTATATGLGGAALGALAETVRVLAANRARAALSRKLDDYLDSSAVEAGSKEIPASAIDVTPEGSPTKGTTLGTGIGGAQPEFERIWNRIKGSTGLVGLGRNVSDDLVGFLRQRIMQLPKEERVAMVKRLPTDVQARIIGLERQATLPRVAQGANIQLRPAKYAVPEGKPTPISDPELAESLLGRPMAAQMREFEDAKVISDMLGKDNPTRFGKTIGELLETRQYSKLHELAKEQRAKEIRMAVTQDTTSPYTQQTLQANKVRQLSLQKKQAISSVQPNATIADVAQVAGIGIDEVTAMPMAKFQPLLQSMRQKLVQIGGDRFRLAKQAKTLQMGRSRVIDAVRRTANKKILQESGITADEAAASLNNFLAGETIDPIRPVPYEVAGAMTGRGKVRLPVTTAKETGSIKAVQPVVRQSQLLSEDILDLDPKGLQQHLSSPEVKGFIDETRRYIDFLKTKASPETKQNYPPTLEGAIQYRNAVQGRREPSQILSQEGDEPFFTQADDALEKAGYSHSEVYSDPTDTIKLRESPEALQGYKWYNAHFTDTKTGSQYVAKMTGKAIADLEASGRIRLHKTAPISRQLTSNQKLDGLYLGTGFGGLEKPLKKWLDTKAKVQLRKMGYADEEIDSVLASFTPKTLHDYILAFSLPSTIPSREPAMWTPVDRARNFVAAIDSAGSALRQVHNVSRDRLALEGASKKAAQELADTFVKWNRMQKGGKPGPTPEQRQQALNAIVQQLDQRGQQVFTKVYQQIVDGQAQVVDAGRKAIYAATDYAKQPPEVQQRIAKYVDNKFKNMDYVTFERRGPVKVLVRNDRGAIVWASGHENRQDAMNFIKNKGGAQLGSTHQVIDYNVGTDTTFDAAGKVLTSKKLPATAKDNFDPIAFLLSDLLEETGGQSVQYGPYTDPYVANVHGSQFLQNVADTILARDITGQVSQLNPRSFVPGEKVTLESIFRNQRTLVDLFSRMEQSAYLKKEIPSLLEKVELGLLTNSFAKRKGYVEYANQYLNNLVNHETNPDLFAAIRSGLSNAYLAGNTSFVLLNALQPTQIALGVASGYGAKGAGHWAAAWKPTLQIMKAFMQEGMDMHKALQKVQLPPEIAKVLGRMVSSGSVSANIIENVTRLREVPALQGTSGKVLEALLRLARLTEVQNRIHSALTFAGIGNRLLGHTGDELFTFADRMAYQTNFGYDRMWDPIAMQGLPAPTKSTIGAAKLFWKFPLENFARLMEAAREARPFSVSNKEIKAFTPPTSTIRGRAALGKSRLKLPGYVLGQLLVGGPTALNPALWISGILGGGALGQSIIQMALKNRSIAKGVSQANQALDVPGLKDAIEIMLREYSSMPGTDQILDDVETEGPVNMTWDDSVAHWANKAADPGTLSNAALRYGIPGIFGAAMSRKVKPSSAVDVVSSPKYMVKRMEQLFEGMDDLRSGAGPAKLISSFGELPAGASEIYRILGKGEFKMRLGHHEESITDAHGERIDPSLLDAAYRLMRIETTSMADLRTKSTASDTLRRRREQFYNDLVESATNHIKAVPGNTISDPEVQTVFDYVRAWNGAIKSRGLHRVDKTLLIDAKRLEDKLEDEAALYYKTNWLTPTAEERRKAFGSPRLRLNLDEAIA